MKTVVLILILFNCGLASAFEDPNIVLIISDDQAWTDYGFMGHERIRTPNLDRLASESVLFRRGYVPTALCRPSLMTLITGQYASVHGITGNDPVIDRANERAGDLRESLISKIDQFETLPRLLKKRGYLTFQSGKWWEGSFSRGGFSHGMTRGYPHRGGRHGDAGLKIGRTGIHEIEQFVDMAIRDGKPFFLWYAPFMPHTPHVPPESFLKHYQEQVLGPHIAKYFGMCEWFDASCGRIMELLETRHIRDNTLIVYVSDNGWIQDPNSNRYAARSKQTAYEGGVRTPILFSWRGHFRPAVRTELCSSIDIFPTIAITAGAEVPADLPGLNLSENLLTGRPIERQAILGESFAHDIIDIDDPEQTLLYRWCIRENWKLILTYDGKVTRNKSTHPRTEKRPQLFDLSSDPREMTNLAADHPEIVRELATRIGDWYSVDKREGLTEFKLP